VEEAYELLDVLDRVSDGGDLTKDFALKADFAEELGDVLLQVLLHAELAGELGAFNIQEVAFTLREKLIRRHPHVFSVNGAKNPEEALKNWESVKAEEKLASGREYEGILSGLPRHLPALQRTARVIEKVTKVGFQWPDLRGPIAKLEEELSEFRDELGRFELEPSEANRARLGEELGDFLFCLANVAFLLKIAPEDALRGCLSRFESRFRYVEKKVIESGRAWRDLNLDDLDVFWREAKELEKK
jgi:tetrapyrrole methylase family protein/MazG family protein